MSDLHIKVGGVWKPIDKAYVKVNDAWKEVSTVYAKVSDAWRVVWENWVVNLSGAVITAADPPGDQVAKVIINSDGTIDKQVNSDTPVQLDSLTDWVTPNSAAGENTFHVRATQVAQTNGGTLSGTLSTWLEIGVDTTVWSITRLTGAGPGSSTWDLTLEVSADGGSTTEDSGLYELTATIVP